MCMQVFTAGAKLLDAALDLAQVRTVLWVLCLLHGPANVLAISLLHCTANYLPVAATAGHSPPARDAPRRGAGPAGAAGQDRGDELARQGIMHRPFPCMHPLPG